MDPGSCPVERFQHRKVMLQANPPCRGPNPGALQAAQSGDNWHLPVFQGVFHLLSVADIRLARLVCKEWAAELACAVHSTLLPASMWQMRKQCQQSQLNRFTSTYQSCRHTILAVDNRHTVDEHALLQAVAALKQLRSLSSIAVMSLGPSSSCWTVTLQSFTAFSSQLTSLNLSDVRLPGRKGLDALGQLTDIQQLTISSGCRNKLQQQHVTAIASMQELKRLNLSFRVVDGTLLEPLTLDCLGQLSKLRHLEVVYTGMSELSTGVCFASTELLAGCTALSSLVLSRVPARSFRGLHKLQHLQHLSVAQLAPLTEDQLRSLGLCTQLQELRVEPIPLVLVATLARLTALTALQASIWSPPQAGEAVLPASGIVALEALRSLKLLALSDPVAIQQEDVQSLSMAWKELGQLLLAAITALWVAAKYEGASHLSAASFVRHLPFSMAPACKVKQLLSAEQVLLTAVDHRLVCPTTKSFLRRCLSTVSEAHMLDTHVYFTAGYLAELSLLDAGMLCYKPSEVAASAYAYALAVTGNTCSAAHLKQHTGYDLALIVPCMQRLARVHSAACNTTTPCMISLKYLTGPLGQVAALPPAGLDFLVVCDQSQNSASDRSSSSGANNQVAL